MEVVLWTVYKLALVDKDLSDLFVEFGSFLFLRIQDQRESIRIKRAAILPHYQRGLIP